MPKHDMPCVGKVQAAAGESNRALYQIPMMISAKLEPLVSLVFDQMGPHFFASDHAKVPDILLYAVFIDFDVRWFEIVHQDAMFVAHDQIEQNFLHRASNDGVVDRVGDFGRPPLKSRPTRRQAGT